MSNKTSEYKTSDKLLRCPFCGGEASLCDCAVKQNDRWMWSVECVNCGVIIDRENKNDVVAAWNTRKLMEQIVERLEETKGKDIVFCPPRANNKTAMLGQKIGLDRAIEIVKEEM